MTIEDRIKNYEKSMDTNHDGSVSSIEVDRARSIIDMELAEEKSTAHRRMAQSAMASIIGFTTLMFTPLVDVARISALSDLFGLLYISLASIVGGYMGVSSWMSKR